MTELARSLHPAAPGRNNRQALAALYSELSPRGSSQETSDNYIGIIISLPPRHRVIECKDHIQWIAQRRKRGGAERPWRSVGHFRTREALIQACASLCERIDPAAMAILLELPSQYGGKS